jgi:intein/homing endonuclease
MVDIERVVTLDELMERVPEELVRVAENRRIEPQNNYPIDEETMSKEPSKAKRIREYIDDHPQARNKDVVEALAYYNVTQADVANVKSQQKRKEGKAKKMPVTDKVKQEGPTSRSSTALTESGPSINWRELDAGVAFVKAAGSVQRAQHLLIIIEQIKAC